MKRILTQKNETNPIEVIELTRINSDEMPISASRVRKLMDEGKMDEVKLLVPPTTFEFLQTLTTTP
jgi:[citrate (pro-3S)-lyase] ligase